MPKLLEMLDAFHGLSPEQIIVEIDNKLASVDPSDVKGIENLKALKEGFIRGLRL